MIRNLFLLYLALIVTLVVSFSMTHREPRADFTYVNPSGIHTLDPARMSWLQDFRVALNLWEGLTSLDPKTTEPIGAAAHFPPKVSDDGLTYTFHIRNNAKWSNGDPVTSHDFVRGWRRAIEPGTSADYAFLLTDNIAGAADYVQWRQETVAALAALRSRGLKNRNRDDIETLLAQCTDDHEKRFSKVGLNTPDDKTLVVRLRKPCPYFLDLTAFATFLPIHESIERLRLHYKEKPLTREGLVTYDPQWTKPDYHHNEYPGLITNGAYTLADWSFKQRARLTINPFFRDADKIRCKTVDMLEYDNVSASIMAYESGDVDFLTDLTVPYQHELIRLAQSGERPDLKLASVLATQFLNFNCDSETVGGVKNPFKDARVRRAFTLATDRRKIVEHVLANGDRPARSFVPPGAIPGYSPPQGLSYDIDRAKALLREAGYASGEALGPIELLVTSRTVRLGEALASMWETALGVRIELRAKESKTFAQDKINRNFMIARGSWYADYNDPTTFLHCLTIGNGNNDTGYASEKYDALLAKANAETDPAIRARLLAQAESIIVETDCPILPISHSTQLIAIKPYVKGLFPNARLWFPFRYVSVDR
jgi:oligopeptide transport system substrate-binding protein